MKKFDELLDVWFNLKWVNALKEAFSMLMPLLSVVSFLVVGIKWTHLTNSWWNEGWLWITAFLPYLYIGMLTKAYSKQLNFQTISTDLLIILSLLFNWVAFKQSPNLNLLFIKTVILLTMLRGLSFIDMGIRRLNIKQILPSVSVVLRSVCMIFVSIIIIMLVSLMIHTGMIKWLTELTAFDQFIVTTSSSLIALIIISLLSQYIWYKGYHGFGTVWAMMMCLWLPLIWHQVELFAFNQPLQTVMPNAVIWVFAMIGGSGSTFALILVLKLKKVTTYIINDSLKSGFFNINESVLYGYPTVQNKKIIIPFMFVPVLNVVVAWLLFSNHLMNPAVLILTGIEPLGINVFLLTLGDIRSVVWLLAMIIMNMILWWPFIRQEAS